MSRSDGVFLRFTDPVLQPREVNHGPRNIKTLDMPKSVSVEVLSSKSKVSVTVDGTTVSITESLLSIFVWKSHFAHLS